MYLLEYFVVDHILHLVVCVDVILQVPLWQLSALLWLVVLLLPTRVGSLRYSLLFLLFILFSSLYEANAL